MLNNAVISKNAHPIINNLFNNIQKGLKDANQVDNITASDLTHQAHDLQDQWSQRTNTKNTSKNNKDKKNTTTLIQRILNLCSKVVNFLTSIKKYLTVQIDNTLTSLKEGMQYCSQLLSGKSNNITTTAATRENSTASQNTTLPSQSTDGVQASTTMFAQANSSIPNRKTENIQPPAANIINNTRHGNTVPPPPPPPPPSSLTNSTRSVNNNNTPASPQLTFLEELQSKFKSKENTNSQNATLPSQSTDEAQASTTMFAQANSSISNRKTENIQPPAANIINNTRHGNTVPPPPPPPPPSSLTNSIPSSHSDISIKNRYPSNNPKLPAMLEVELKKRRAAFQGDDNDTIDNDLKNQHSTRQELDNTSQSLTSTNNTGVNLHIPSTPSTAQIDDTTRQALLADIKKGQKLKKTPNKSTNQETSVKEQFTPITQSVENQTNLVAENENRYFTPLANSDDDWDTDDDRDIQNTNNQQSWTNQVSQGQDSRKQPIADILLNNKKQMSYTEREKEKKTLNESKPKSKGRN